MQDQFLDYSLQKHKYIDVYINELIPQHLRMSYPNFVRFIELFLQKITSKGEGAEFIHNMLSYANVDETSAFFLDEFCKNYLKDIEYLPEVNRRTLVKWIRQWYAATGSQQSYKFLFRVLYNKDVDFYLPSVDMLRVSDGKWVKEKMIRLKYNPKIPFSAYNDMVGTEIQGSVSGALALVERVEYFDNYVDTDGDGKKDIHNEVIDIYLTDFSKEHPITDLIQGESIICTTLGNLDYTWENEVYVVVTHVDLLEAENRGNYYRQGDAVRISHGVGSDCFVVVKDTTTGNFTGVKIIDGGEGYAENDRFDFVDKHGFGAYGYVSEVDSNGKIVKVTLANSGSNYRYFPDIIIKSEQGKGAILSPVPNNVGGIQSLKIVNPGINYRNLEWSDIQHAFYHYFEIGANYNVVPPVRGCSTVDKSYTGDLPNFSGADDISTRPSGGDGRKHYTDLEKHEKSVFDSIVEERKIYTFPITFLKQARGVKAIGDVVVQFVKDENKPIKRGEEVIFWDETLKMPRPVSRAKVSRIDNTHNYFVLEMLNDTAIREGLKMSTLTTEVKGKVIYVHNSQFNIETGFIVDTFGKYNSQDGWIDSEKKIQDSYFYQIYSYVLVTDVDKNVWEPDVMNTVHPAGLIAFDTKDHCYHFGNFYGGDPIVDKDYTPQITIITKRA